MGETFEHKKLKELIKAKFMEWWNFAIIEYPDNGNEIDVLGIDTNGIRVIVEIIWRSNFYRDVALIQRQDADVIIPVVHPNILANETYQREMEKTRADFKKDRIELSEMFDGQMLLDDRTYADREMRDKIRQLMSIQNANKQAERMKNGRIGVSFDNCKVAEGHNIDVIGEFKTGVLVKDVQTAHLSHIHVKFTRDKDERTIDEG